MRKTQAVAYAVAVVAVVGAFAVTKSQPTRRSQKNPDDKTQVAQARKGLDAIAKLQKRFYKDSGHYTGDIETLALATYDGRNSGFPSVGWIKLTNLTAQGGGWSATLLTPKYVCGIAVGNANPISAAARSGESACAEKSKTSVDTTTATDNVRRARQAMSFLRDFVSIQEAFFADSARYSDNLRSLMLVAKKTVPFVAPTGFSDPELTANATSWMAIVKSPRYHCAIAVNRPNPVKPSASTGEPGCVEVPSQ